MKFIYSILIILLLLAAAPVSAEVTLDGFLQGLYGGGLHGDNPTETEYTASETRMQLRLEHFGDEAEVFGRLDFWYDGALGKVIYADASTDNWELREAYLKFRLGSNLDFKIGRQILTWGTGDLIFINDVFAKDYQSFFIGRDDQYLKAPQNSLRAEYYNPIADLTVVWSPRFEPNRIPIGQRLSFYIPGGPNAGIHGGLAGHNIDRATRTPSTSFQNIELATRLSRSIAGYQTSLYAYRGFYKNPVGVGGYEGGIPGSGPLYPFMYLYGFSIRGTLGGGILWMEAGYLNSHWSRNGADDRVPNSSVTAMAGYERQVATNLTANVQWQVSRYLDGGKYMLINGDSYHNHHLLTTRITKLLLDENLTLSGFVFYSPTAEDGYLRVSATYKHTDEVTLAMGGNIFSGTYENTEIGQYQKNDNVYMKVTYGF